MENKSSPEAEYKPKFRGIFIQDGMSLRLKDLKIVFGPNGVEMPPPTIELSVNMCPNWMGISINHLRDARTHREQLTQSLEPRDEKKMAKAMEEEFRSAMQAIVAAAFGMDAMYSSVKQDLATADELTRKWRQGRTARYKQVAEVLRQVFGVNSKGFKNLRYVLLHLFRFRDWAVHPPPEFNAPQYHAVIECSTEWRYVAFTYDNAFGLVRGALGFTRILLSQIASDALTANQKGLSTRLSPHWAAWETEFGPLTDEPTSRQSA